MQYRLEFLLLFVYIFSAAAHGQTPPVSGDDDVVKITSKLVQFDVIVQDKDGRQVNDLKAADFEVLQDGKPQTVTNLTYINTDRKSKQSKQAGTPSATGSRRVVTFIVDDGGCYSSMMGMAAARQSLEKFVGEQMRPDDIVAIYQTRGGSSMLQQYTSDKQLLMRIIRKIRWYPAPGMCSVSGGESFDPVEQVLDDNQVIGSIGVMRYVVQGLDRLPGRKVVFLISNGLPVYSKRGSYSRAFDALRDLTDRANRASVIFHTIHAGGLSDPRLNDMEAQRTFVRNNSIRQSREEEARSLRDGLYYLADETGGGYFGSRNFLESAFTDAMALEKGYYLIAYEPDDDTFRGKKFNKLEIKVKRPELKVLTRAGFIGITDEASKPKRRTGSSELYEAIVAPIPEAGLKVRLTAYFGNTLAQGNFVRSMFHLEGNEIKFTDEGEHKKAVIDVVAVTLNERNEVVDEFTRTHTLKVPAAAIPMIRENGLIYSTDVPIRKPGTYNYRVAVRDAGSGLLGSSGQVVEIKDLTKGAILLSGLSVTQADEKGVFVRPSTVPPEKALSLISSKAVPSVRQFRQGSILAYAYTIYNARTDAAGGQNLTIQVNLFRDGQLVSEGKPQPAQLQKPTDPSRIEDFGYLQLRKGIEPGDYALQVIVKDLSAKGDKSVSSQMTDFEVLP